MAVGIPAPQVIRVRIKGTYAGSPWNVIQYLQYSGTAPSVADLGTVKTQMETAYANNFNPLANAVVINTGWDLADLTNPAAAAISLTAANTGTRAGTAFPASVAMVSSYQINVRYRGGHPRNYWPFGVTSDMTSSRLWSAAFVTSANTALANYRTALNNIVTGGITYKWVAVSFQTNHTPRAAGVPYTINSVTVHGRLDTQRHRLGKETP